MAAVRVSEIFSSIQGESHWAGYPCIFVRLTGCNLDCLYCDTRYARSGGEVQSVGAVLAAAGIGAIALFGAPSASEVEFRRAVAWTQSDPVFASLRSPSDVLLEQPDWALLKSGSPSRGMMSGLSDMLNLDAGFNDERNES